MTASQGIPIIDLAPLRDGSAPGKVAAELRRASEEVGFIYVSNHGVDPQLISTARQNALRFFRSPHELKLRVAMEKTHRGFIPIGDSSMYEGAEPDQKETFVWGFEPTAEERAHNADNRLRCANRWPDFVPELKASALAYFGAVHGLASNLMQAFAVGLGLAEDAFVQTADRPVSRGSFVYYPPRPKLRETQFGVGAHSDFGVLTILCQDDVGGLQVRSPDGLWLDATPISGTFVVNVGDLLERWSNDRYRSTPHRVINSASRERLSLVTAYDPNFETLVDPATVCGPGETALYKPVRCGDYLNQRFGQSFQYQER